MIENDSYPVLLTWDRADSGRLSRPDALPELTVAPPPQFGGPAGVWTPEHLFVASVSSCLMTTFLAMARFSKLLVEAYDCAAEGTLTRGDDRRYRITHVTLRPRIVVATERDRTKAERLITKAEGACLISRSIRADTSLEVQIDVVGNTVRRRSA